MKFYKFISTSLILCGIILIPQFALAQANSVQTGTYQNSVPTGSDCGSQGGTFKLCNPLGVDDFCNLVKALLNIIMAIGMPIAVLFLVWSGFRFILARGSATGLDDAKRNFKFVILGIAIFLGAWTLASIISATIQTLDTSGTIQFCGR